MPTPLRNDFDAFLFASIGEDSSGIPVSLLTVLARLDIDPWEEAASLAQLPIDAARERLAFLLATMPNGREPDESVTIATRLVALLHQAPASQVRSTETPVLRAVAAQPGRIRPQIYLLIALVIMLVWQWAVASRQPRFPADDTYASEQT